MRHCFEIENIENLRQLQGIDDVELRVGVRKLRAGSFVKVTLLGEGVGPPCETVVVRVTSIKGQMFRGKLAKDPVATALAHLHAGSAILFTAAHIHSLPK